MAVHKIRLFIALAIGVVSMITGSVFAQIVTPYPDKPITIVVPYPPGGFNDTLGRIVGKKLADAWGASWQGANGLGGE